MKRISNKDHSTILTTNHTMNITNLKLVFVAAVLSFALLPASAYDFEVNGFYYTVVSQSDFTCKVTSGDNKYIGNITLLGEVAYNKQTYSVVSIGESAFKDCSGMTSLTVPKTVTSTGDAALDGCSGLESLVIEDGLDILKLGRNAFSEGLFHDSPLKNIYLGRNLSYKTDNAYGYSPFHKLEKLSSLTIGNSVTSIGEHAFWDCTALTSLIIGSSVTEIGRMAFSDCESLTSLDIPNSVTSIGSSAFSCCI